MTRFLTSIHRLIHLDVVPHGHIYWQLHFVNVSVQCERSRMCSGTYEEPTILVSLGTSSSSDSRVARRDTRGIRDLRLGT